MIDFPDKWSPMRDAQGRQTAKDPMGRRATTRLELEIEGIDSTRQAFIISLMPYDTSEQASGEHAAVIAAICRQAEGAEAAPSAGGLQAAIEAGQHWAAQYACAAAMQPRAGGPHVGCPGEWLCACKLQRDPQVAAQWYCDVLVCSVCLQVTGECA